MRLDRYIREEELILVAPRMHTAMTSPDIQEIKTTVYEAIPVYERSTSARWSVSLGLRVDHGWRISHVRYRKR